MDLKVFWTAFAEEKLEEVFNYYKSAATFEIARRMVDEIVEKSFGLANHPYMGQKETQLQNKNIEFRYLVHKRHKIVYFINDSPNQVEIVNVFDCRKNTQKMMIEIL